MGSLARRWALQSRGVRTQELAWTRGWLGSLGGHHADTQLCRQSPHMTIISSDRSVVRPWITHRWCVLTPADTLRHLTMLPLTLYWFMIIVKWERLAGGHHSTLHLASNLVMLLSLSFNWYFACPGLCPQLRLLIMDEWNGPVTRRGGGGTNPKLSAFLSSK